MNTRNFLLNICLGTGLFFPNYFLVTNKASAVSFKPSVQKSSLENILGVDLSLEEGLNIIPLEDIEFIESPRQIELPVQIDILVINEDIKVPLQIIQQEQLDLSESLVTSLKELELNGKIINSEAQTFEENGNTVIILSQTDSSNIYQDIYDFETDLTDDFRETPRNISQNVVEEPESPRLFKQEILTYIYVVPRARENNLGNINQNTSQIGASSSVSRNYSYIKPGDTSYYTQSQAPITNNINSNNIAIPIKKIRAIQSTNITRPSLKKTKEQIKLEKKLVKQREELRKKNQESRRKLEEERKERAKKRAKEEEKRAKEQKKLLERIAKQQAKFRNSNR